MRGVIIGRTVHYVLTDMDIETIRDRRAGYTFHGATPTAGEHVAMIMTRVLVPLTPREDVGMVNGHCILDGDDSLWVVGVKFDEVEKAPGTWHWIEKS